MKAIGCIVKTQDDGFTLCNECSMADDPKGNDSAECKQFRKETDAKLRYK